MPVATSQISSSISTSAKEIPQAVWDMLRAHPRAANVILPHAEKALAMELKGELPTRRECWITCSTFGSSGEKIDFILSCTDGAVGSYPIFIVPARPSSQLDESYLLPRLSILVKALHSTVKSSRVYSIFAPDPVAKMFADLWVDHTGIAIEETPYYAAMFTFCTEDTYMDRPMAIHSSFKYEIRPAVENDIANVADLCCGFALGSVSFFYDVLGNNILIRI